MGRLRLFLGILLVAVLGEGRKGFGPGEQEWGFVEVRPGAHMFWWLYYTTATDVKQPEEKPLVIWLQGGPGASGTGYGNFMELGPLDEKLQPRNYTWVKDCNVLFIDNPVGTGFSYVTKTSLLTKNNAEIAKDLVEMMKQFYKELPNFENTPLYILSESYGGKMTAEFGLEYYKEMQAGKINGNLKGVGLGDSWISPIDSVMTWAPFLLQLGVVDKDGYQKIMKVANATKNAFDKGAFDESTQLWGETESMVLQVTGGVDFYNVLTKTEYFGRGSLRKSLRAHILPGKRSSTYALFNIMNQQVKKDLDLPLTAKWSESSSSVFQALNGDFMKPVTHIVEKLLNETDLKVAVYTGQLDLIVDTPGTYKWVNQLRWPYKREWETAPRRAMAANNIIEGYKKEYGKFGMYWVDRAGHMVPADNPTAMNEILKLLTNNYNERKRV